MDWIEVWFGVSPDGGDGSLERMIFLTVVVVVIALTFTVSRAGPHAITALAQMWRAHRAEHF